MSDAQKNYKEMNYVYKNDKGILIFSHYIPAGKSAVNIDRAKKVFMENINNNMLLKIDNFDELAILTENLYKNKFRIPYSYGIALIENDEVKNFCENSDFRFFKNEVPNINNMLTNFFVGEELNFFKFANALGCFSKEKIVDKNGKETEIILAQKASTLLMRLLKTDKIRIRRI